MFKLGILIGIYSYLIYFLGIFKLLYLQNVFVVSIGYLIFFVVLLIKQKVKINTKNIFKDKVSSALIFLVIIQILIYSIGTFAPEIGFDALWYHLTIPKIFINNNMIFHIPGNLFYYSDMPKLVDILYIPALMIGNELFTKLIHFSFGILAVIALYNLSRKLFSQKLTLLSVMILTSNLVFAWEMNTSYIDLAWLFFEILSLTCFIEFIKNKTYKNLFLLAIFVGLTISVKLSAISSLFIYLLLLLVVFNLQKNNLKQSIKYLIIFILSSTGIVLPYLIFSYLHTQNPFYPLFTKSIIFSHSFDLLNFLKVWIVSPDPVNPIYFLIFPLIPFIFRKLNFINKIIVIYCLLGLCMWYFFGQIGGSRYLLPYLAGFSILTISVYKNIEFKYFKKVLLILILGITIFSTGYRLVANSKYIPHLIGRETKDQFLIKHLNFSFGDFYDTDKYFKNNITNSDIVLTIGFHNLYYANFNFIDYSYLKKGDKFNYIAVQNTKLPDEFKFWKLIHTNALTNVKIYSLNKLWVY